MALYVPVGIPGCGKSSLARKMIADGTVVPDAIIEPDAYRALLTGDHTNQTENATVFDICHKIADKRILHGLDVYFDATNLGKAIYGHFDRAGTTWLRFIILRTPLDVCLARNNVRAKPVPEDILRRMHDQLEDTVTTIRTLAANRPDRLISIDERSSD
jgi:predicted kinase